MFLALLGCVVFRTPDPDPRVLALQAADEHYANRHLDGELELALRAYQDILAAGPVDRAILFRLARAFGAAGLGDPTDAGMVSLEVGRQYGLQCLMLNTGFASRVELGAWQITERAVRQLEVQDRPCIDATLIAWVRWVERRGPAGAVDLRSIDRLARRVRLMPESGWVGPWANAMVLVLPEGPSERPLADSRVLFEQALALEPNLTWLELDLAAHQLVLEGESGKAAESLWTITQSNNGADGWAYENKAARAEAQRRLDDFGAVERRSWSTP